MAIEPPKIDKNNFETVIKKIMSLAPYYVPEWSAEEKEAGFILSKISSSLMEKIIYRLNQVPEKNFIAYLEKLGIKLLPAQSSSAPVTFKLSDSAKEHVLVPEKTQIAAKDVVFETEKNMLVAPAKLIKAYSIDISGDAVYESPPNVIAGGNVIAASTSLLYDAKNQDSAVYVSSSEGISKGDMLIIGKSEYAVISEISDLKITLSHKLDNDHRAGSSVEKVTTFELFEGKNLQEHILYLGHKNLFNLKKGTGKACYVLLKVYLTSVYTWKDSEYNFIKKLQWEYRGEDPKGNQDKWLPFRVIKTNRSDKTIEIWLWKIYKEPTKEREINGIKNFWLRSIGSRDHTSLGLFENIQVDVKNVTGPDICFYNDVPVNLAIFFYPFGKIPRLYDTFYIASQETFSKKGATIRMQVVISNKPAPSSDLSLSWEYWNGKGWMTIKGINNYLFNKSSWITFECPADMQQTKVNGQENNWIRVKIVSGDYGKEKFTKENNTWEIDASQIKAPEVKKITITSTLSHKELQYCLSYNNMEWKNITEESNSSNAKFFKPFVPLDVDHQSMYLGFDKKLEKGPICVFFSIEEQLWGEKLPFIEWEYYAESGKWTRLEVVDETRGFTQSGVIEFVFQSDFAMTERFGKELYWIRAVDVKDSFKPINLVYAELFLKYQYSQFSNYVIQNFLLPAKGIYKYISLKEALLWNKSFTTEKPDPCKESYTQIEPCPEYLNVYHPQWAHPEEVKKAVISPKIKGIFLNTTWAVQTETVKDELLGSSDGTADQSFLIQKTPVISEEIWVNEIGTLTENEQKEIIEKGSFETKEVKDEKGKLTEFWIKWEPVEELLSDSPYDRHYEMDSVSGEIVFGNGINGKIPPTGSDNIKANYQTGGGIKGNVAAYKIKDQRSSVQYIDKIFNPLPADGGTDVEPMEETIERGPKIFKHRNRAVAAEDFEQMAYQASRAIAKAKCLPDFNDKGEFNKTGWVTVIVIQKTSQDRPKLSLQMKKKVESYLRERTANTVIEKNRLQVSEPVYIEVVINASLKATSPVFVPLIEKDAIAKLKEFLHPLSGGYEKKGWEFGTMPCFSDYYALLEGIDGVDHVRNISLTLRTYSEDKIISEFIVSSDGVLDTELPPYAMIYSGNHKINVGI